MINEFTISDVLEIEKSINSKGFFFIFFKIWRTQNFSI